MSTYSAIDGVLSDWAVARRLHWLTEYQDTEVRTFYVGEGVRRAQIAVDPPANGLVKVHVGQALGRGRSNRFDPAACPVAELPATLDEALERATEWLLLST